MAKSDAATTESRLNRLVDLTVDERQQLSDDLASEFELADSEGNVQAMKDALAGLQKMDMYEDLLDRLAEVDQSNDETDEADDTPAESADEADDKSEEDSYYSEEKRSLHRQ